MKIPLLKDGQWATCEHPVADNDEDDYIAWMNNGGYSQAVEFCVHETSQLHLTVWGSGVDPSRPRRAAPDGAPKYLVDVELTHDVSAETVAAHSIVDLMTLLSNWAPALQAAIAYEDAQRRHDATLEETAR